MRRGLENCAIASALSLLLALAVPAGAATPNSWPTSSRTPSSWPTSSRTALPNSGRAYGVLYAIRCPSSSACWAVGQYAKEGGPLLNQVEHLQRRGWSLVSVPQPSGRFRYNELDGIGCLSNSACWAVGSYNNGGNGGENESLRLSGTKWSVVATPQPGGRGPNNNGNALYGISCRSKSDCWAVGSWQNRAGAYSGAVLNETLHFNGKRWSHPTTPQPGGIQGGDVSELAAVSCTSASNCWAAGGYGTYGSAGLNEVLHYDGTRWSLRPVPQPGGTGPTSFQMLTDLRCLSKSDCWAVGYLNGLDGETLNEVLHFNGKRWLAIRVPQPDGSGSSADQQGLNGIACASSSNCWAVGGYINGAGAILNDAIHFNGSRWSLVETPQPGGTTSSSDESLLYKISCPSKSDCWAVGQATGVASSAQNEVLHWNGSRWSAG